MVWKFRKKWLRIELSNRNLAKLWYFWILRFLGQKSGVLLLIFAYLWTILRSIWLNFFYNCPALCSAWRPVLHTPNPERRGGDKGEEGDHVSRKGQTGSEFYLIQFQILNYWLSILWDKYSLFTFQIKSYPYLYFIFYYNTAFVLHIYYHII